VCVCVCVCVHATTILLQVCIFLPADDPLGLKHAAIIKNEHTNK